jgi:peptide/nickel transport system permease protein
VLTMVVRRLLLAVPTTLGVCTVLFFALHAAPGSPADRFVDPEMGVDLRETMERKFGLDRPLGVQYVKWIGAIVRLDFGYSFFEQRPVLQVLADAMPNTLLLCGVSLALVFGLGVLVGVAAGVGHRSRWGVLLDLPVMVLYAIPGFLVALALLLVFAYHWPLLPASGPYGIDYHDLSAAGRLLERVRYLLLPALALSLAPAAGVARYVRTAMIEALAQPHVRAARARGLSEMRIVVHHALRNALLPLVTLLGLYLPFLLSGTVLIESVFGWPGMGKLIVDAIGSQDFPVVLGNAVLYTFAVIGGNLLADVLYMVVDPRTRRS